MLRWTSLLVTSSQKQAKHLPRPSPLTAGATVTSGSAGCDRRWSRSASRGRGSSLPGEPAGGGARLVGFGAAPLAGGEDAVRHLGEREVTARRVVGALGAGLEQ